MPWCVDESVNLQLQFDNEHVVNFDHLYSFLTMDVHLIPSLMVRGLGAGLCTPPGSRDWSRGEAPVRKLE